jgi:predicted Zn-dependent protease
VLYASALAADPRRDRVRLEFARFLVRTRDLEAAEAQYAVLSRRTPADTVMLREYAKVLDGLGRQARASQLRALASRLGG